MESTPGKDRTGNLQRARLLSKPHTGKAHLSACLKTDSHSFCKFTKNFSAIEKNQQIIIGCKKSAKPAEMCLAK
jgi:hypothetical protein